MKFKKKLLRKGLTAWFIVFLPSSLALAQKSDSVRSEPVIEISLQKEVEHAIEVGLNWLEQNQLDDGSWSSYPGITSLVITAFLRSPRGYTEENNAAVYNGIQFLLRCVQPDGGIYLHDMPGYNTSVALVALVAADNPDYTETIRRARDFLIDLQADEEEGYDASNVFYGGIGYGGDERPDMSNMQFALEALKESENYRPTSEGTGETLVYSQTVTGTAAGSKELFWEKAILFLQRCQNLRESNDQEWASDDGGFVYYPGFSQAGGTTSYGTMTYAGMRSFIYAQVDRHDPRVQAAYDWIRDHFTLDKNPEMGDQGLYYYYHTMAKALDVYGEEIVTDKNNVEHNWREEFLKKVISLQHGDGYWVNQVGRWWENNKDLVTAYAILALEQALSLKELEE
ncbi:MAG: terpene cyclase/mutase family protein [Gemmatimonadota bacterium]|nr:MAG: terpene cyclase/mutase family protein [Gemmatimonadota bacterium]